MSISTENPYVELNCDGSKKKFEYPHKLFDVEDDIVVTHYIDASSSWETLNLTTDYTSASLNDDPEKNGCVVTTVSAYPTGDKIKITRNVALKQLVDFVSGGTFSVKTIEKALDRLTIIAQQLSYKIDSQ